MPKKDDLIYIGLSPKEYQFIEWMRDNFKCGKIELKVHNHQPEAYIIKEIEGRFDGNVNNIKQEWQ